MNIQVNNIVSITEARSKLSGLTDKVSGGKYVVLTKGGEPKVALVDVNYLAKLEDSVAKIYQKTYIDPKLVPYTREFSNDEVATWLKEDQL